MHQNFNPAVTTNPSVHFESLWPKVAQILSNWACGFSPKKIGSVPVYPVPVYPPVYPNELKKLCEEQGIKQILTKDNQDRWGLNRVLGCCK